MGGNLDEKRLRHVLERLASVRPIFHSEADFQHALAWQVQLEVPTAAIRLETRPFADRRMYLDLAVNVDGHRVAIELKHLTRGLSVDLDGEVFNLSNQSAHDIARYDVVKDIRRVEELLGVGLADSAYVIVLTNDSAYWRPGWKSTAADANFRFHEDSELSGTLDWGPSAGPGTRRGREGAVILAGSYVARWADYSAVPGSAGRFRYLLIEASASGASMPAAAIHVPRGEPQRAVTPPGPQVGDLTCRQQILDAMKGLERRQGRDSFAVREIVEEVQRRGTSLAESTIRTHVTSVMCVDAPSNHPTRYPDLRLSGPGRYQRIR